MAVIKVPWTGIASCVTQEGIQVQETTELSSQELASIVEPELVGLDPPGVLWAVMDGRELESSASAGSIAVS